VTTSQLDQFASEYVWPNRAHFAAPWPENLQFPSKGPVHGSAGLLVDVLNNVILALSSNDLYGYAGAECGGNVAVGDRGRENK
jgi:hypothetical protein